MYKLSLENSTHLVLVRITLVLLQRNLEQPVFPGVLEGVVKVLVSGLRDVAESTLVSAQMVVNAMPLDVMGQRTQSAQEGEVLPRILIGRASVRLRTEIL